MPYRLLSVDAHATGLRLPTHLAVAPDDRIFVSEFAGGAVRDVSEAGDYSNPTRGSLGSGLNHPGGLLVTRDGDLLVADTGDHSVCAIGEKRRPQVVARHIPNAYGLVEFENRVLVTYFADDAVGIAPLSNGGRQRSVTESSFVSGFPCITVAEPFPKVEAYGGAWAATALGNRLLLCHAGLGTVFDVSGGGSFDSLRRSRFAWGMNRPAGMIADPLDDDLYVSEKGTGTVRHVSETGYARFAPPLLAGFTEPVCVRFDSSGRQMFVADRAAGTVYVATVEHAN